MSIYGNNGLKMELKATKNRIAAGTVMGLGLTVHCYGVGANSGTSSKKPFFTGRCGHRRQGHRMAFVTEPCGVGVVVNSAL